MYSHAFPASISSVGRHVVEIPAIVVLHMTFMFSKTLVGILDF
jgi:hypothetical protein